MFFNLNYYILNVNIPDTVLGKEKVDTGKFVKFTSALDSLQDPVELPEVMIQISSLSEKEKSAAKTLAESPKTKFTDSKSLLNAIIEKDAQEFQTVIRVLEDNGYIPQRTSDYTLSSKAYDELPWL